MRAVSTTTRSAYGDELHGICICIALSKHSDPGGLSGTAFLLGCTTNSTTTARTTITQAAIASDNPTMLPSRHRIPQIRATRGPLVTKLSHQWHYRSVAGLPVQRGIACGLRR